MHLRLQLSSSECACCYLFSHPSQLRVRPRLAHVSEREIPIAEDKPAQQPEY